MDEIKIDKSFVINMKDDENDASIIRATVGLAHDLGLSIVAEGVENQESQDLLQALNCEYAQGFHICKPAPAKEIGNRLDNTYPGNLKKQNDTDSIELDSDQIYKPA